MGLGSPAAGGTQAAERDGAGIEHVSHGGRGGGGGAIWRDQNRSRCRSIDECRRFRAGKEVLLPRNPTPSPAGDNGARVREGPAAPSPGFSSRQGGEVIAAENRAAGAAGAEGARALERLQSLPIFAGIPADDLRRLLGSGELEWKAYERDVFVADAESVSEGEPGSVARARVYLLTSGQIGVAVFDGALLQARKAEQERYEQMSEAERQELSLLKPPPLAREARKNLATFMAGDLFNSAALVRGASGDVAFYTIEPSLVISVSHKGISELAVRHPFFHERMRRAVEISRDRLRNIAGVKQEILDFFIRHGISVSGELVRVRQLDSCIDCKLCEEACEERYGAKRLTLGGYQLGMLDFVYTCRTCSDQRCLDPCEYDSIRFDPDILEVVINEASCVGCTLCAQACPFEAIEMVDIEDPANPNHRERFKLRLANDGALAFGPGKPRVARPRRIANKCDHCMNYGDQACVSACPTGSLIEVSGYDLFQERSPIATDIARAGYEGEVALTHAQILPQEPFTKGVGVRDAGLAKTRRGRIAPVIVWGLALAAWCLASVEILLRIYAPQSSLQYVMLRADGLEPVIAEMKVGFRSGSDLAIYCGWLGTALMLLAIFYTPLRRIKGFRRIASNTMWFDFHMMAGTMGPAFILQHSALNYTTYAAGAFWSMVIVVFSGIVGRYLYTQVPDLLNGRELEELDHRRALANIRLSYPDAVAVAEELLAPHRRRAEELARTAGLTRAFFWIVGEDLRRPGRWWRRRRALATTGAPRKIRRQLSNRIARQILIERRRVLAPRAQLVLHSWKKVHVPFSIIMALLAAYHVWKELPKTL